MCASRRGVVLPRASLRMPCVNYAATDVVWGSGWKLLYKNIGGGLAVGSQRK